MEQITLSRKQLLLFIVMILSALGLTLFFAMRALSPPTIEDYMELLDTPSEEITYSAFRETFGNPTYQQTVGGDEYTYYNFNPNRYQHPHQVWVDNAGATYVVRVFVPEELRDQEQDILLRFGTDPYKYTQYNIYHGHTTILAYPEQGKSFILADNRNQVVEWMFYPPLSTDEYIDLYAHRGHDSQDAP